MAEKFRSIDAFRKFEQRTLTDDAGQAAKTRKAAQKATRVNPFRVLALLKQHPEGIARDVLLKALGASEADLDTACLKLMGEGLVRVEPSEQSGADMLFPI